VTHRLVLGGFDWYVFGFGNLESKTHFGGPLQGWTWLVFIFPPQSCLQAKILTEPGNYKHHFLEVKHSCLPWNHRHYRPRIKQAFQKGQKIWQNFQQSIYLGISIEKICLPLFQP